MIRKLAAAMVFSIAAFLGTAAERALAQDYAAMAAEPALWTIEHGDTTVHLFGTFHLLPPELEWKTDSVTSAMLASDRVWFEADIFSAEAQQTIAAIMPQLGLNPEGVTLSSLLDAETAALLAEVAPTLGVPPQMLEPLRPWLAALTLTISQIQALGFDPNAGVEAVLYAEAREAGQSFGYFETAEQQMGFFGNLSDAVQVELLAQTLREVARTEAELPVWVEAWATGDMDAINRLLNVSMRDQSPEMYAVIMVDRNRAWIPQILEILEEGGTHFIAVGAGHMPGEEGVIALLEAEGLTVTRH